MLQKLRRIKQFSFLMHVVSPFKLTIGKHSKSAPIVSTWVPLKLYGMLNSLCREKPLYFGLSELNAESKKIFEEWLKNPDEETKPLFATPTALF